MALTFGAENGFRRISSVQPALAFDMRKIVWVFNSVFGLMEVVEAQAAYLVLGEQRALLQADDRHVRRPRNLSGGKMIFRLGCVSSDETKTDAQICN
jgi:hypothetical protein